MVSGPSHDLRCNTVADQLLFGTDLLHPMLRVMPPTTYSLRHMPFQSAGYPASRERISRSRRSAAWGGGANRNYDN